MKNNILFMSSSAILLLALVAFCEAAPEYVATSIEFGEQVQDINIADLNGDGRKDLIVSNWNEDVGRELWVYRQQADEKYPSEASHKIEIKRDIIAFATADIRAEPGDEILFFTAQSMYSYSTLKDGYTGNLQKISDWLFVSAVPSSRSTPFLGHFEDDNNDGTVDILAPGKQSFGIVSISVLARESSQANSIVKLPLAYHRQIEIENERGINISLRDGFKVEVNSPSLFEGLVVERLSPTIEDKNYRFDRYDISENSLLSLERWIDNVQSAQFKSDANLEYLFIDENPEDQSRTGVDKRINIVSIDNGSAQIIFQSSLKDQEEIKLFDLDDDGLMDILAFNTTGSNGLSVSLYLNHDGEFDFNSANQVIKFTGFDPNFVLTDVNFDGHPDLVVNVYQISALNAIRDGAISRLSLIYAGNPTLSQNNKQTIFDRRPSFKLEEKFSADDIKGLIQPIDFSLDLDQDNNKDAVAVDVNGALTARKIDHQFKLNSTPFWQFAPMGFIQETESHFLNEDDKPDFILRHQEGITSLISQQR